MTATGLKTNTTSASGADADRRVYAEMVTRAAALAPRLRSCDDDGRSTGRPLEGCLSPDHLLRRGGPHPSIEFGERRPVGWLGSFPVVNPSFRDFPPHRQGAPRAALPAIVSLAVNRY